MQGLVNINMTVMCPWGRRECSEVAMDFTWGHSVAEILESESMIEAMETHLMAQKVDDYRCPKCEKTYSTLQAMTIASKQDRPLTI